MQLLISVDSTVKFELFHAEHFIFESSYIYNILIISACNKSVRTAVRTTCNKPVGSTMLLQIVLHDSLAKSCHEQA